MTAADRVVLMHAGGWDEILMVVGPLAIIAVLVVVARKNVPVEDDENPDEQQAAQPQGERRPDDRS